MTMFQLSAAHTFYSFDDFAKQRITVTTTSFLCGRFSGKLPPITSAFSPETAKFFENL